MLTLAQNLRYNQQSGLNHIPTDCDISGVLDEQTKREMAKPRCAFPDIITPKTEARTKRFVLGE